MKRDVLCPTGIAGILILCCFLAMGAAATDTQQGEAATQKADALYIASVPTGATVWLDGVMIGTTNMWAPMKEGKHTVRLVLDGYEEYQETFTIRYPISRSAKQVTLQALPKPVGEATFVTIPNIASVYVDGVFVGTSKVTVKGLLNGKHEYTLSKYGFKDVSGMMTIYGGRTTYITKTLTPNKTPPQMPVICNQPYGLCTTAKCLPKPDDPKNVICNCNIEDGVSLGMASCDQRKESDLYYSAANGWMIPAGAHVGRITSTYSFINAVPTDEGKIPKRTIDPNYTGNIILKSCLASSWANCLDMKCVVPPADPNADISKDRKAADYAICECEMVKSSKNFFIGAGGGEGSCTDPEICRKNIWSAADIDLMVQGIQTLKAYLAAHPKQDPAQQYAMPFCPANNKVAQG